MTGRLVARGLDDELKGSAYVVIDGVDGRVHHIRMPHLDSAGDSAPGSIVELRRFQDAAGRPQQAIAVRSDLSIDHQATAQGATWIDRQLVAKGAIPLSEGGFGAEVREAMDARIDHLVAEGLARRQGQRVVFARDLLENLRGRELEGVAARVAAETGLAYQSAAEGEHVAGIYRQRVTLASGRFAMIDNGLGFSRVPWSPSLEHYLGKQVSGITMPGGDVANVLIRQAKASDISVNFILSPSERSADMRALKAIANATYGLVVDKGQLAAFLKAPFALLDSGMTAVYPLDDARHNFGI